MIIMPLAAAIELFTALVPFAGDGDRISGIYVPGDGYAYATGRDADARFFLAEGAGLGFVPAEAADWVRRTSFRSLMYGKSNPDSYFAEIRSVDGFTVATIYADQDEERRNTWIDLPRAQYPIVSVRGQFTRPAPKRSVHAVTIVDPAMLALATPYVNRYAGHNLSIEVYPVRKGESLNPIRLTAGRLEAFVMPKPVLK